MSLFDARAALFALALAGCTTTHEHIFGAYRYDPTQDCLESAAGVDIIDGPDPGTCIQLRCWFSSATCSDNVTDAACNVYVTDAACDAPPDYTDHTADTSGPCVQALNAYKHDLCPPTPDGGM